MRYPNPDANFQEDKAFETDSCLASSRIGTAKAEYIKNICDSLLTLRVPEVILWCGDGIEPESDIPQIGGS
jgi:hypothetical protein